MSRARIHILTTAGPVEIQSIVAEDSRVPPLICLDGTTSPISVSTDYVHFVQKGSGVIERITGHGAYRLDVSADISGGRSWQLGVFTAHMLARDNRLASVGEVADLDIFVTGEVDGRYGVRAVGHVTEKLRLALPNINAAKTAQIWVPHENILEVSALGLPCKGIRQATDIFSILFLDTPEILTGGLTADLPTNFAVKRQHLSVGVMLVVFVACIAAGIMGVSFFFNTRQDTLPSPQSKVISVPEPLVIQPTVGIADPPKLEEMPAQPSIPKFIQPTVDTLAPETIGDDSAPESSISKDITEPKQASNVDIDGNDQDVVEPQNIDVEVEISTPDVKPTPRPQIFNVPALPPASDPPLPTAVAVITEERAPREADCISIRLGRAQPVSVRREPSADGFGNSILQGLCALSYDIRTARDGRYRFVFIAILDGTAPYLIQKWSVLNQSQKSRSSLSWKLSIPPRNLRNVSYELVAMERHTPFDSKTLNWVRDSVRSGLRTSEPDFIAHMKSKGVAVSTFLHTLR